jgi:hypothetical protein
MQMLQSGACDGAVLAHNDWQIAIETQDSYKGANAACNLQSTGQEIRTMYVSLPYRIAHGEPYCTSFLGDVFSAIISQMQAAPFQIEAYWTNALASLQQTTCRDVLPVTPTSTRLSILSMAGLFVWYVVTTGVIGVIFITLNLLDFNSEQREYDAKLWIQSKLFKQIGASDTATNTSVGTINGQSNDANHSDNSSSSHQHNQAMGEINQVEHTRDGEIAIAVENNSNPSSSSTIFWW